MAYDDQTAERVRHILSGQQNLVERKMMGSLCFMVSGNMCCGVRGPALMVRVGPDAYRETLLRPHVRPLEFGGRRPAGFVVLDPEGFETEAALRAWVRQAVDFAATLPAKAAATRPRSKAPRRRPA